MRGFIIAALTSALLLISPAHAGRNGTTSSRVVASGQSELCAAQAFGTVFPWGSMFCLNNTFGTGNLVSGASFVMSVTIQPNIFPSNTRIDWAFPRPSNCTGCGGFAFGYPEVVWGRSETGGNPYKIDGPWFDHVAEYTGSITGTTLTVTSVQSGALAAGQIIYTPFGGGFSGVDSLTVIQSQLTGPAGGTGTYQVSVSQTVSSRAMSSVTSKNMGQLTAVGATYDLTQVANEGSSDILFDLYVSTTFTGGAYLAEISIFPQINLIPSALTSRTCTTFTGLGETLVGIQGAQVHVIPTTNCATTPVPRNVLATTYDFKQIFNYLVSVGIGGVSQSNYLMGFQLGVEAQVPAVYNSGPANGYLIINKFLPVWQ